MKRTRETLPSRSWVRLQQIIERLMARRWRRRLLYSGVGTHHLVAGRDRRWQAATWPRLYRHLLIDIVDLTICENDVFWRERLLRHANRTREAKTVFGSRRYVVVE